jgi:hypothetical protein
MDRGRLRRIEIERYGVVADDEHERGERKIQGEKTSR